MKLPFRKSSFFVGLILLVSIPVSVTWAGRDDFWDSPTRPTAAEFLKAFDGLLPEKNPYSYSVQRAPAAKEDILTGFKNDFAGFVVQLEKAFPGAIYAALGRDSAYLADALEAFYLSIGKRDRVYRLGASTGSFQGRHSDQMLTRFLEDNGLDLKNLIHSPGYVIFDGTQCHNQSQSRQLVSAAYRTAHAQGIQLDQLPRKLNVVGTNSGYYAGEQILSADVARYFENSAKDANVNGPSRILVAHAWAMTHGAEWHQAFGPFQEDGTGRVSAQPGALTGRPSQEAVLGMMYEIIKWVQSPSFHEQVMSLAKSQNLDLSLFSLHGTCNSIVRRQTDTRPKGGFE